MALLSTILGRGLAASRPASGATGQLYYSTDTGVLERWSGAAWQTYGPSGGFALSSHTHAATDLASATVATARLGSGTADSSSFLRGDQTWSVPGAGITRVSGPSGASGADVTLQCLSSDAATNSTSTFATVITTTGVGVGIWHARYAIRYQSAATSNGVQFKIDHGGTTTWGMGNLSFPSGDTAGIDGFHDQNTPGIYMEVQALRAFPLEFNATEGVDTANADLFMPIETLFAVTVSGSLTLQHASEQVAGSSTVKAGTSLILTRVG
jgi:hypothetical protein